MCISAHRAWIAQVLQAFPTFVSFTASLVHRMGHLDRACSDRGWGLCSWWIWEPQCRLGSTLELRGSQLGSGSTRGCTILKRSGTIVVVWQRKFTQ